MKISNYAISLGLTVTLLGHAGLASAQTSNAYCTARTPSNYTPGNCDGWFVAGSANALAEYYSTGYGGVPYKNLRVTGNLSGARVDVLSPCKIVIDGGNLTATERASVDGLRGVTIAGSTNIGGPGANACVFARTGSISVYHRAVLTGREVNLNARDTIEIWDDVRLDGTHDIHVKAESWADSFESFVRIHERVLLRSGGRDVVVRGRRAVIIGRGSRLQAAAGKSVFVESYGNATDSIVGTSGDIQATAQRLRFKGTHGVEFGPNGLYTAFGTGDTQFPGFLSQCTVTGCQITLGAGSLFQSGGGSRFVSAGTILVNPFADVNVTAGISHMEAALGCQVDPNAKATPQPAGNCSF